MSAPPPSKGFGHLEWPEGVSPRPDEQKAAITEADLAAGVTAGLLDPILVLLRGYRCQGGGTELPAGFVRWLEVHSRPSLAARASGRPLTGTARVDWSGVSEEVWERSTFFGPRETYLPIFAGGVELIRAELTAALAATRMLQINPTVADVAALGDQLEQLVPVVRLAEGDLMKAGGTGMEGRIH